MNFLLQNIDVPLQLLLGLQRLSCFLGTDHRLVGDCVPHVDYSTRKDLAIKNSNTMVFDLGFEFFLKNSKLNLVNGVSVHNSGWLSFWVVFVLHVDDDARSGCE